MSVCSHQNSVILTIVRQSHQIDHTCYGIHTIWVVVHTEVVCVHTRNQFIHTEIEQFIVCGTNITLNLVSSPSTLAT